MEARLPERGGSEKETCGMILSGGILSGSSFARSDPEGPCRMAISFRLEGRIKGFAREKPAVPATLVLAFDF
jgi:hypothetical protein